MKAQLESIHKRGCQSLALVCDMIERQAFRKSVALTVAETMREIADELTELTKGGRSNGA